MTRRPRFVPPGRRAVLTAALLLASTFNVAAQDDDIRRHGIFLDSLDVSLVNVEVVALLDGQPVTDLTRDDFEVFDDGEPVEVTHFFRVESGRRIRASGEAGDEAETEPAPLQEPATIVVLVDQAFLSPASRARVFKALDEKLDALMTDGTQVMVASKQRQVRVEQRPTSDRAEVDAAINRLGKVATLDYTTNVRNIVRQIEQGLRLADLAATSPAGGEGDTGAADGDASWALHLARNHSLETFSEVRRSLQVLRGFLGSLAGLPGRKAVLYVCDRLPLRPGELVWNVWFEKYGADYGRTLGVNSVESALREFDTTGEVRDLIADAAANRIAFYPVGAGPISGINSVSAENRSTTLSPSVVSLAADVESGLRLLAFGTGGQAAAGGGGTAWLFDRLRQDLTHYYSLAYPSPHRGDGEAHKIDVRVKRPGVKLHYLERYRDKSGDQEMSERTLAALMLGATDNPLDVRVTVGEMEKQKDGSYLVAAEVRFPIANLVLLPQETAHVGRVSIVFIVRDENGRTSEPAKVLLPIEIPHLSLLQALSQTAVYTTRLAMRRGEQTIAVGVRDDLGAIGSTVNVDVRVGGSRG